jgi:hypothetical protein
METKRAPPVHSITVYHMNTQPTKVQSDIRNCEPQLRNRLRQWRSWTFSPPCCRSASLRRKQERCVGARGSHGKLHFNMPDKHQERSLVSHIQADTCLNWLSSRILGETGDARCGLPDCRLGRLVHWYQTRVMGVEHGVLGSMFWPLGGLLLTGAGGYISS